MSAEAMSAIEKEMNAMANKYGLSSFALVVATEADGGSVCIDVGGTAVLSSLLTMAIGMVTDETLDEHFGNVFRIV